MSDFADAIKNALSQDQKEKEKATTKKSSTKYVYDIETDPNDHLDTIITKKTVKINTDGTLKENILQKLFILFSKSQIILQVGNDVMTDEYTLTEGLDKFFNNMPKCEITHVNSIGMIDFVPDNPRKCILKAMVKEMIKKERAKAKKEEYEPKIMLSIKNGEYTVDRIYEGVYSSWRKKYCSIDLSFFPWMTHDDYVDSRSYSEDLDDQINIIIKVFSKYNANSISKQIAKEFRKSGIDMRLVDENVMNMAIILGDYFDVPFAVKCMVEYVERDDLDGLTYNAFDELFTIKQGQRNYYMNGGGMYEPSVYTNYHTKYTNEKNDIKEDVNGDYYVKFKDKNAFWEYITKRSFEEDYNLGLSRYIHKWRNHLMLEIYIYNDVINMYPSQCKYLSTDDGEVRTRTRDMSLSTRCDKNLNKAAMIYQAKSNASFKERITLIGDTLEGEYTYYNKVYYLKCLRTQEDYAKEGRDQNNCVASCCLSRVLQGENMAIFSLRKGDDREHSWITIDVDPFTGEFPSRLGRALKKGNASLNDDEKKLVDHIEAECMKKVKELNKRRKEWA